MPVACLSVSLMAQDRDQTKTAASNSALQATAVLGFEGISNNATGDLSIQGDALVFQPKEGKAARIPVGSIQNAFLSQTDKQTGGTPMAVTRAAIPFGGGRVIGAFAHKKYDFLTFEYLDSNGGFHGAICQLNQGQGQVFGKELEAKGVHFSVAREATPTKSGPEAKNEDK